MNKVEQISKTLDSANSLAEVFFDFAKANQNLELFSQGHDLGPETTKRVWQSKTYKEVYARVCKIANFLKSQGISKGAHVAVVSNTRPEWLEADFAILALGGVTVSVYQSLIPEEIAYILCDADVELAFVENQEQVDKLLSIQQKEHILPKTEDQEERKKLLQLKKIISFETSSEHPLVANLSQVLEVSSEVEPQEYKSSKRDDLASLVYTSGTTGVPKGVIQTHGNHLANVRQVFRSGMLTLDTDILLFLPLAHSFAKLLGLMGFLSPVKLKFPTVVDKQTSKVDTFSIARDMREANAQVIPVVPRLLEKMKDGLLKKARQNVFSAKLIKLTLWAADEKYQRAKAGKGHAILAELAFLFTFFMRKKIKRTLFGNNFWFALSGGAALDLNVIEFFESLKMLVIQGYGLTETCVATNANRPFDNHPGTVGPVLDKDIELRIAEDGEILYRGPNISQGYYKRPKATAESWDEQGWFYTGDLGSLNANGFLSIVGRKKELIVSSNGKKIAPYHIEEKLKESPYVLNAVLLGNNKSYCSALIVLEMSEIKSWAEKENLSDLTSFVDDTRVFTLIWQHVQKVNENLSSYESVKKIALISEDFSLENGLLTPTLKLKRKKIEERYQHAIQKLYPH